MQANFDLMSEIRGLRRMADYFVDALYQAGCTHIFAMPAESLNSIVDAVRKHGGVRLVTVRHEGNGALMASAFAKLSGRLGVCMGTAGPGATHLPIGTYDARADGAPLIAFSGQVWSRLIGAGGFQEIDSVALHKDSTDLSRFIGSVDQTEALLIACARAIRQRTAVHVTIPADVLVARMAPAAKVRIWPHWLAPNVVLTEGPLRRAAERLSGGGTTAVLLGAAGPGAGSAIAAIADKLRAPIFALPEAIQGLGDQLAHPTLRLSARRPDEGYGLVRAAARVLVVGRWTPTIAAVLASSVGRVVHVATAFESSHPVHRGVVRICGDIVAILEALTPLVSRGDDGLLTEVTRGGVDRPPGGLDRELWTALDRALPRDAVVSIEPGALLEGAFHHLPIRGRAVTSSFQLGARGYGLPGAIAAALAAPERPAVGVMTEEGLAESMADLLSARKHDVPVKLICIAGDGRGAGRIDFAAVAAASQLGAHRAAGPTDIPDAAATCLSVNGPSLLWVERAALGTGASLAYALGPRRPDEGAVLGPRRLVQTLLDALARAGVTRIYGRPHLALAPLIAHLARDTRIAFVPVAHSESASMMASAYSKWTGSPGVCVAGDSEDLLLQLNGLYDAAFDRNPVLMLTPADAPADEPLVHPERLLADVAVWSTHLAPSEEGLARLCQALREANRQRSVVHVSIDWFALEGPAPALPDWFDPHEEFEVLLPDPELVWQAADRLRSAHRAVILAGRGAAEARAEIERIADVLGAPIVSTMPGRGIVSDDHPRVIGSIGASGHRSAIDALNSCDVLLSIGSSARGAVYGFTGQFTVIQVDRDPLQLGRRPFPTLGLHGSARPTLAALLRELERPGHEGFAPRRALAAEREQFSRTMRSAYEQWRRNSEQIVHSDALPIRPPAICQVLLNVLAELSERAVITVDVGVTTLWVYRYFVGGSHQIVWTSSFATMGFSLPAAIAIKELEPSRPVIAMTGDGGIGITMAELAAAAKRGVPVVAIVFNNGKLAAIKFEQEVMGWPEYEARLHNCDFSAYAAACGAHGIRVTRPRELADALREALTCGKPCIVDVVCDPHDLPAPPRIHPRQAAGYLIALLREGRTGLRGLTRSSLQMVRRHT